MSGSTTFEGSKESSTIHLDISDVATDEQRQFAQQSIESLAVRSAEATARRRAHDDAVAELSGALNAPLVKLLNDDPGVSAALEKWNGQPLLIDDDVADLGDVAPQDDDGPVVAPYASFAVGPPYDFAWSFHENGGYAPHNQILNRANGQVALDARSGAVASGASGWVKAHCGFGIFLPAGSGQKYPHAVLNPGSFNWAVAALGFAGSAVAEGGFDLAIFENGQYLTGANIKLYRKRVSGNEQSTYTEPKRIIAGPELQFTMQPGRTYTFNAGIWVYSDRSHGAGQAGAQSAVNGMLTKMWSFGY